MNHVTSELCDAPYRCCFGVAGRCVFQLPLCRFDHIRHLVPAVELPIDLFHGTYEQKVVSGRDPFIRRPEQNGEGGSPAVDLIAACAELTLTH